MHDRDIMFFFTPWPHSNRGILVCAVCPSVCLSVLNSLVHRLYVCKLGKSQGVKVTTHQSDYCFARLKRVVVLAHYRAISQKRDEIEP